MLVLAAGGVGKSAFALEWAAALGAPCLYISLDTSLFDHGVRLLARSTGLAVDEVQDGHDARPAEWTEEWSTTLGDLTYPIRFCDTADTVREIGEVVAAETEYWGEAPLLTIIDNLGNLLEQEEGAGEYRRLLSELHKIAKHHDTLVMALHHLRRRPPKGRGDGDEKDEGTQPVHLSDALYEGDKEAQYVLGLWRPNWKHMRVGVLKNRMGEANRTGSVNVVLDADLRHMRIEEPQHEEARWSETS